MASAGAAGCPPSPRRYHPARSKSVATDASTRYPVQEETSEQQSITVSQGKRETSQHLGWFLPANPAFATNKQGLRAELI